MAAEPVRFSLYCDEDSHAILLVSLLRDAGMDVLRSTEAGMDGRSDEEQFAFANRCNRVLYTANKADFARIMAEHLRTGGESAGVIFWDRGEFSLPEQARRLVRI